MATLNQFKGF